MRWHFWSLVVGLAACSPPKVEEQKEVRAGKDGRPFAGVGGANLRTREEVLEGCYDPSGSGSTIYGIVYTPRSIELYQEAFTGEVELDPVYTVDYAYPGYQVYEESADSDSGSDSDSALKFCFCLEGRTDDCGSSVWDTWVLVTSRDMTEGLPDFSDTLTYGVYDCDDNKDTVNASITEDTGNRIDDDCDGYVDEGGDQFDDNGDCFCEDPPCVDTNQVDPEACKVADATLTAAYDKFSDCSDSTSPSDSLSFDETDLSTYPCNIYYADSDGDEYGATPGDGDVNVGDVGTAADSDIICTCDPTAPSGYVAQDGDCDDGDDAISPMGSEGPAADGLDNNCDGKVDEGTDAWDNDGDCFCASGYDYDGTGLTCSGTEDEASCNAGWRLHPKSYVGDCDDGNSTIYPGADEIWYDGTDQDCSCSLLKGSSCSEEEDWASDCDADEDGYVCNPDYSGDQYSATPGAFCGYTGSGVSFDNSVCTAVALESGAGLDCLDEDPDAHPGAGPEVDSCGDQIDQNCDTYRPLAQEPEINTDNGQPYCDSTGYKLSYPDDDGDGYGDESELSAQCLCEEWSVSACSSAVATRAGVDYFEYGGNCYASDHTDCDDSETTIHGLTGSERLFETLDGHDNDCDKYVPIAELDCDQDQYFPVDNALIFDSGTSFRMLSSPADVGLGDCRDNLGLTAVGSVLDLDLVAQCKQDSLLANPYATSGSSPPTAGCRVYKEIQQGLGSCVQSELTVFCSLETGFLVVDARSPSADETVNAWFDAGHRVWSTGSDGNVTEERTARGGGDCDDLCASRSPGEAETCDGRDNDCNNASLVDKTNYSSAAIPPVPPAMLVDATRTGFVNRLEADLDRDGFLECDSSTSASDLENNQDFSINTYGQCGAVGAGGNGDCNDLCSASVPGQDELSCDNFWIRPGSACAEPPGDPDGDGSLVCGPFSSASSDETDPLATESVYVLVYFPDGLAASATTPTSDDTAAETGAPPETGGSAETGAPTETGSPAKGRGPGGGVPAVVNSLSIARSAVDTAAGIGGFVPLILPRGAAPECDAPLMDALAGALEQGGLADSGEGRARVEEEMVARDAEAAQIDGFGVPENEDPLLDLCKETVGPGAVATCVVVRLTLSEHADDDLYGDGLTSRGEACAAQPQQAISRSVWTRQRILEARRRVLAWDCFRMFGQDVDGFCAFGDPDRYSTATGLRIPNVSLTEEDVISLKEDPAFWLEIGRFVDLFDTNDGSAVQTEGVLTGCWGEPANTIKQAGQIARVIASEVGGDCDEDDLSANRYQAEGPGDLYGAFVGEVADCSTCRDGADNNCDGFTDCEDPACAPCFDGHLGAGGCGGDPCVQSGCATGAPRRGSGVGSLLAAVALGLGLGARRRLR